MRPRSTLTLLALVSGCGKEGVPFDEVLPAEVIGVANIDDDDASDDIDWEDDARAEGDDDLVAVPLPDDLLVDGRTLALALDGDVDVVRVWWDGAVLLDEETLEATRTAAPGGDGLEIEFGGFRSTATLGLVLRDEEGATIGAADIALLSSPLLLNHHLQVGEQVVAMEEGQDNAAFVAAFEELLGERLLTASAARYGWDVWIQDEIEFATLTAPDHRMDVVVDSVRSGRGDYLDAFAEDELQGPGVAVATWGHFQDATSQDSFGNLEVSPPVTVDGVDYPYGRIYWGEFYGQGPDDELTAFLEEQAVQDPFAVDVSWLCVGHVDEFASFLPDPTAPKGFRLYLSSTRLGWELLQAQDPDMALPRYAEDHGYATVAELLADGELEALQVELQADYIDAAREVFAAELGLTDDDIVEIPAVYEVYPGCGGAVLSLIPGTINMTVVAPAGDATHLFLPDPFFRADGAPQEDDPVIAAIAPLLPPDAVTHWIDDWDVYHLMMGEVHCGSNTRRTAWGSWWEDARHLLGGEE